jgi:hypothetical protein
MATNNEYFPNVQINEEGDDVAVHFPLNDGEMVHVTLNQMENGEGVVISITTYPDCEEVVQVILDDYECELVPMLEKED